MELTPLSHSTARSRHAKSLGLGSGGHDEEYLCEVLRSLVWLQSEGNNPVHTHRILNTAIKISISDLEPDVLRIRLSECLADLDSHSDIISFPRGYWLPAPLRAVQLPREKEVVLVGGVPSCALPSNIRSKLVHNGPIRRTKTSTLKNLPIVQTLSLEEWSQIPDVPLCEWADGIMGTRIEPIAVSELEDFSFYLPDVGRNERLQFKRWRQSLGNYDGKCLGRRSRKFGGAEYHVVEARSGRIIGYSSALPYRFGRRLMYAEDLFADRPTQAILTVLDETVRLTLGSAIPFEENKIFRAIGKLISPKNEYPIVWDFSIENEELAISALEGLGIRTVTTKTKA